MAPRKKTTKKTAAETAPAWLPRTLRLLHCELSYPKLVAVLIVFAVLVAGVIFGVMSLTGGYWPWVSEETRQVAEVERVVAAAGKLMLLPENETPLVASIVDADVLQQEQPFYQGAQNGDQLLIYGESLRAIIYSPSRNIIVNAGPVELPQEPRRAPVAPTPAATTDNPAAAPADDIPAENEP